MVQPELRELAVQRLREGPVTLEALGDWLLLETARWRRQDARKVAQALKDEGDLVVEPSGRLTKASTVRLR
jgi:hypothetical protein